MKRYIKSSIASTTPYKRKRASYVTRQYLLDDLDIVNILDANSKDRHNYTKYINDIVSGILGWKVRTYACYHHLDLDTDHNYASNIILVDPKFHGFIHNPSTELQLFRRYELVLPGYVQGPLAERLERKMYKELGKELNFQNYGVNQILNVVKSKLESYFAETFEDNAESREHDLIVEITNALCDSDIQILKIDNPAVIELKAELDRTRRSVVNVAYVDQQTASTVAKFLESLQNKLQPSDSRYEMTETSIESIQKFIQYNTMSDTEIKEYNNNLPQKQ